MSEKIVSKTIGTRLFEDFVCVFQFEYITCGSFDKNV
jgi:hypothetical protein